MAGAALGAQMGMQGLQMVADMAETLHSAKQASDEARKMRKFQAWWASNKYQVTVQDMMKAGLNPILAVTSGAMAPSMPSGAMAHIPRSKFGGEALASAIPKAIAVKNALTEGEILKYEKEKRYHEVFRSAAEGALAEEKALNERVYRDLTRSQIEQTEASTRATELQMQLDRTMLPGRQTEAEIDSSDFGQWLRYINRINPFAGVAERFMRR